MTTYARIIDGQVVNTHELTAEQYAALVANGKAAHLRLWIVDAQPTPSATQVVVIGPVVVGPVEAHQTWVLRDKTARELEDADLQVERNKIDEILAEIVAQRAVTRATWDGHTAAQLRAEQWRDRQVLLRLANFIARRVKQEIA